MSGDTRHVAHAGRELATLVKNRTQPGTHVNLHTRGTPGDTRQELSGSLSGGNSPPEQRGPTRLVQSPATSGGPIDRSPQQLNASSKGVPPVQNGCVPVMACVLVYTLQWPMSPLTRFYAPVHKLPARTRARVEQCKCCLGQTTCYRMMMSHIAARMHLNASVSTASLSTRVVQALARCLWDASLRGVHQLQRAKGLLTFGTR